MPGPASWDPDWRKEHPKKPGRWAAFMAFLWEWFSPMGDPYPTYQKGGLIQGPQPYILGDQGPETIVPLPWLPVSIWDEVHTHETLEVVATGYGPFKEGVTYRYRAKDVITDQGAILRFAWIEEKVEGEGWYFWKVWREDQ